MYLFYDPYLYGLQRLLQEQLYCTYSMTPTCMVSSACSRDSLPAPTSLPSKKSRTWRRRNSEITIVLDRKKCPQKKVHVNYFFPQVKLPHLWLRPVLINFKYLSILTLALYWIYVLWKGPRIVMSFLRSCPRGGGGGGILVPVPVPTEARRNW